MMLDLIERFAEFVSRITEFECKRTNTTNKNYLKVRKKVKLTVWA